ncbi:class I SAM-dependent methyltransferase [Candidatus Micrarchaeota archaeon]|nr:class I SAM-dependent methyltransferase [Candidatus Micrarchaeota archaeon]
MVLKHKESPGKGSTKFVGKMQDWAKVAGELQGEDLKQKIYDNTLLGILGEIKGKHVLDYGGGPAVIAARMKMMGADTHLYDINEKFLEIAGQKLGQENVHPDVSNILNGTFDVVTCNLVVCIVPEAEVVRIAKNIKEALASEGVAYVGFCNPRICKVRRSLIDIRHKSDYKYEDNHTYRKTKKEGGYDIDELHRPIGWYNGVFDAVGLRREGLLFTQEYEIAKGRLISDFVIFKLTKGVD